MTSGWLVDALGCRVTEAVGEDDDGFTFPQRAVAGLAGTARALSAAVAPRRRRPWKTPPCASQRAIGTSPLLEALNAEGLSQ